MRENLLNLYIRHNSSFKSLSAVALTQLILKVLFINRPSIDFKSLKQELSTILYGDIKTKDLNRCIRVLIGESKIIPDGKKYILSEECIAEFQVQEERNKDLNKNVIDYWFSKSQSGLEDIAAWFDDVLIRFFEQFYYEWISELKREKTIIKRNAINIEKIIDDSFKEHGKILERDQKWLKRQFLEFIDSSRPEDNKLLWLFGIAQFSAKLIHARIFTDNISAEMFRDSTFILDTNVLMILGLEGFELSNSLRTLEEFFKKLNIKLLYLNISRTEYMGANEHLRQIFKNIFRSYSPKVRSKLSKSDPHTSTILKRKCQTEDDIDTFFSQLIDVPEYFQDDYRIEKLDHPKIDTIYDSAKSDEILKSKLNEINLRIKQKKKKENALIHDATLIKVAESLRETTKCWILTRDSTLISYGINNTFRNDEPLAVSLIVLLNLLTYSNDNLNPEEFAALFATLVKLSLVPDETVFTHEDLQYILDTNIEINNLPDEEVISIASELNVARINGISDEEASLLLQRKFQKEKFKLNSDLEKVKIDYYNERKENERLKSDNKIFIDNYKKKRKPELIDKYERKILTNRIMFFILIPVISFIGFYFIMQNSSSDEPLIKLLIDLVFSSITTLLFSKFVLTPKIIKKYSDYVLNVDDKIDEEIRELNMR